MFSPFATGPAITSDFTTLVEVAAAVFALLVDVLFTKVFFVAIPVALEVADDFVIDDIFALGVVVEGPSTFAVLVSEAVVLLVADLAVPGEGFWAVLAVVERIRLVVFLVSFSGTGLVAVDSGLRGAAEAVAGRDVVVLEAGLLAVPFTLLLSVFSIFLAGALTGLLVAVVAEVVVPAVVLAAGVG